MADIDLYLEEGDGNTDDGYGLDDGMDDEPFGADDNLSSLQKLEKYMESDNVYTRQMVAKGLLDTLRAVGESEEQTTAVLTAMVKLSDDSDPIVRSELMEQIAHIAVYCHENKDIFQNAIPVYILPMVVRYLDDANTQVRKTSQAALLVLLEQELVEKEHIEDQVVSVILELAGPDSLDEYRTEAVALMSKLAPLLGQDMVERVFLNRFCEMCCDPLFHVRKVCAGNFGDFCSVVGQASVEKHLLSKFYYLCADGVWGVRKACAECFMTVSYSCSAEVRKTDLASVFVSLLCDQSRWVRMAAFQQLGPFISTFADSNCTGISVEPDGTIVLKDHEQENRSLEEGTTVDQNNSNTVGSPEHDSEVSVVTEIDETEVESSPSNDNPQSFDLRTSSCASTDKSVCDNDTEQVGTDMEIDEQTPVVTDIGAEVEERGFPAKPTDTIPDVETGLVVTDEDVSLEEKRAKHYIIAENQSLNTDKMLQDKNNRNIDKESAGSLSVANQDGLITKDETQRVTIEDENNKNDNLSNIAQSSSSIGVEIGSQPQVGNVQIHVDSVDDFNSFNYWRTPIPLIDIDLSIIDLDENTLDTNTGLGTEEKSYASHDLNDVHGEIHDLSEALSESLPDLSVCDKDTTVIEGEGAGSMVDKTSTQIISLDSDKSSFEKTNFMVNQNETTIPVIDGVLQDINLGQIDSNLLLSLLPLADLSGTNMAYIDSDFSSMSPQSLRDSLLLDDATLAQQQDIVPQSLLENYLGMIDPSRAQTVDTEITKHCAYNLPAVAYTLGRKNWHCIKNLYETLAADMQWKVRRTLAFSIHELAVILGEEITHRDLVPVFDGFLKDLDEVRIGILRHLADFLRLLRPDVRKRYLAKVSEFMILDNNRNWRFRLELAEQLVLISELFAAKEVGENLLPLALGLADDRVCEVRIEAYHLISVMLKRLADSNDEKLVQVLVSQLTGKFANNPKWGSRQIYTQMCKAIIEEEAVEPWQFIKDFLPSLLTLKDDPVPNVRITLAKTLTVYLMNTKYSSIDDHPMKDELEEAYKQLQGDTDKDVRYFSSAESCEEPTNVLFDSFTDSWEEQ